MPCAAPHALCQLQNRKKRGVKNVCAKYGTEKNREQKWTGPVLKWAAARPEWDPVYQHAHVADHTRRV
eukprot:1545637-Rhodomonas_salina.1